MQHRKGYRRNYTPEQLNKAYTMWKEGEANIYKAAKLCGVPQQTLRDRSCGVVNPMKFTSGPDRFLTTDEERALVSYVKDVAACGYKVTRKWLTEITGETAFYLKKKNTNASFSVKWVYRFLLRWPELKITIPKSLPAGVESVTTKEPVENCYKDLLLVLQKYDLLDKPHRIYNMFETMVSPKPVPSNTSTPIGCKALSNVSQQNTILSKTSVPTGHKVSLNVSQQKSVSPKTSMPTGKASLNVSLQTVPMSLISCMNAAGEALPPYLVFQGKQISNKMLTGALGGTRSTSSKTGCTDSKIYEKFLTEHFLMSIHGSSDNPTLLLYDGRSSHIHMPLIEWALDHDVLLFLLPFHASTLLHPLDGGASLSFEVAYQDECCKFLRTNPEKSMTGNNVCRVAAKAYRRALTPGNITAAFRQAGVFPFNASLVGEACLETNADTLNEEVSSDVDSYNVDTNNVDINVDTNSIETNISEQLDTNVQMVKKDNNIGTNNADSSDNMDTNSVDTNSIDTNNSELLAAKTQMLKQEGGNNMDTKNVDANKADTNYVATDYVVTTDGDSDYVDISDIERNCGDPDTVVNIIINDDGTWQLEDSTMTSQEDGCHVTVIV